MTEPGSGLAPASAADLATARAMQDARVRVELPAQAPEAGALRTAVLAAVRAEVGWPEVGVSQDETVIVRSLTEDGDGWRVLLEWVFDHDFASQYDRTERRAGELLLGSDLTVRGAAWDPGG